MEAGCTRVTKLLCTQRGSSFIQFLDHLAELLDILQVCVL